jgi:hypothetical protein
MIEFEEAHSHAPRQFLHMPADPALRALLRRAHPGAGRRRSQHRQHLRQPDAGLPPPESRHRTRAPGHHHQFHGPRRRNGCLDARFGLPVSCAPCSRANFLRSRRDCPTEGAGPALRCGGRARRQPGLRAPGPARACAGCAGSAGRAPGRRIRPRRARAGAGHRRIHARVHLLGAALERRGVDVVVQSTTRSPILVWGAVGHALDFPDNYGEGIANFCITSRPASTSTCCLPRDRARSGPARAGRKAGCAPVPLPPRTC